MDYNELLERAFSKASSLSKERQDFSIPEADVVPQGSKTIVRNLAKIADAARRGEDEIAKYITKELAVPVSIEEHRLVISSRVDQKVLNDKIAKFFNTYVICKECKKPDTHYASTDRGFIVIVCEACGARYTVKHY
jgi:translation initiation factor 2 subunit 2